MEETTAATTSPNHPNHILKKQRELRGWSQAKVAKFLNTDERSISRWETGAFSPSKYYQDQLCELFKMDAQQLGFLQTNGYTQDTSNARDTTWPLSIPDEPYYALPDRERDVIHLLTLLQDRNGPVLLSIDGLGGMGKTALAAEVARRAIQNNLFTRVLGESARLEEFTGGEIIPLREATLDFDHLLNALARQLGQWGIATLKMEEKRVALAYELQQHPYLLFIDNLETAGNANAIVTHLRGFLGLSRAIITSRKQVRHGFVYSCSLQHLTREDALAFLRREMQMHGLMDDRELSEKQLVRIYEVTGGMPLAMKLVVAQSTFLNLEVVLRQLAKTHSDQLYAYIFRRSWEHLTSDAQKLLYYIGKTAIASVDWEELSDTGITVDERGLIKAIDQLVSCSLLEVSTHKNEKWYGIHPLTRHFITSDLPNIWREQGLL